MLVLLLVLLPLFAPSLQPCPFPLPLQPLSLPATIPSNPSPATAAVDLPTSLVELPDLISGPPGDLPLLDLIRWSNLML